MITRNELGLMRTNVEGANEYDKNHGHGLPTCAIRVIRDADRLINDLRAAQDVLDAIHAGAVGLQSRNRWAGSVVRLINHYRHGDKKEK